MTTRNITQADSNLLIALNMLLEERNVKRAANRLALTQFSVSRKVQNGTQATITTKAFCFVPATVYLASP